MQSWATRERSWLSAAQPDRRDSADGQDNMKGQIWRLSHMGYTDAFDVLGALSALELVLLESGFKLDPGAGVAAFQKSYGGKLV